MAHTTTRVGLHDAKVAICKTKFQLPTTSDIITVVNHQNPIPTFTTIVRLRKNDLR